MSDTSLPVIFHYGTNAERLAFTPDPAAGVQQLYKWYESDTDTEWSYTTGWHQTSSSAVATVFPSTVEGRLTTESGVPVSAADRTAQGSIFFTPCTQSGTAQTNGNITLYTGASLVNVAFTQLTLTLTVTSGKNYDVFVDYNSGTPQLVLSAAWTNDTTRADALGVQSGIIIKSGTAAYRWVGTIRASGSNVTADAAAFRFVWNAYNQMPRAMQVVEATDSWTYSTATWRQANAAAANQLAYVTGDASLRIEAVVLAMNSSTSATSRGSAVGVDSTTVPSGLRGFFANTTNNIATASYAGSPGLGYHFLAWLEIGSGTVTNTWFGDAGTTDIQSGIRGWLMQ